MPGQEQLDGYTTAGDYYYKTGGIYLYGVIWVLPVNFAKDFDLYLYEDSDYASLLESSEEGAGMLDWVTFYWNGSLSFYYSRVYVHAGSAGTSYIEYDAGTYVSRGAVIDYSCYSLAVFGHLARPASDDGIPSTSPGSRRIAPATAADPYYLPDQPA